MIKDNTVFILGAGASKPYNYPTGSDLKGFITSGLFIKLLSYLSDNYGVALKNKWEPVLRDFVETFRNTTNSIDVFLTRRPKYLHPGKLAILYSIFDFEQGSEFGMRSHKEEGDWYSELYNIMTNTSRGPGEFYLGENRVSFISFNYDRSLEHFLYNTSISSFGSELEKEIKANIGRIPINHIYGKIADLPWEQDSGVSVPYQINPNKIDFLKTADKSNKLVCELWDKWSDRIYIIGEERDNQDERIDRVQQTISESKRIFFLGFGFADENMEILGFPKVLTKDHRIYATTPGLTEHQFRQIIVKYMSVHDLYSKDRIIWEDMNCLQLLQNHF